jgi:hypothetical protein
VDEERGIRSREGASHRYEYFFHSFAEEDRLC